MARALPVALSRRTLLFHNETDTLTRKAISAITHFLPSCDNDLWSRVEQGDDIAQRFGVFWR